MKAIAKTWTVICFALILSGYNARNICAATVKGAAAVASITGQVDIRQGRSQWAAARKDDILNPGDSVRTGAASKARLVLDDGTLLMVGELSVFLFKDVSTDFSKSSSSSQFSLESGAVRAVVEKKLASGSDFTIETPTAVAGVRGTDFEVELDDTQTTSVTVFDGQVEVGSILSHIKDRVLVDAEHSTEVFSGRPPVKPRRLDKELLKQKRQKLAKYLNADTPDKDDMQQDQKSRVLIVAYVNKLPDDQKQKLLENVQDGRISVDDARNILSSVHRGVDRDVVKQAMDIAMQKDVPRDKLDKVVELLQQGKGAEVRKKLEELQNADTRTTMKNGDAATVAGDAADRMNRSEDIEKLKQEIIQNMDKDKAAELVKRMDPNDPQRRELQFIQEAIEKGIPRDRLEPLVMAMKKGVVNDAEARMILEAVHNGLDLKKLNLALQRMRELKLDPKLRILIFKALASRVDVEQILEKLKAGDLTPEQIRQRLEQLIKDRLQNATDIKAQPTAPDAPSPSGK